MIKRNFMILWVLITFFPFTVFSQGAIIKVLLKDGTTITGELLSVRENSLVVYTKTYNDSISAHLSDVSIIKNEEVLSVIQKGKSKISKGIGYGLLIGAGTGALIGFASGDDGGGFVSFSAGEKAVFGGVLLGSAGLIIGIIWGSISSTRDISVIPLPDNDYSILKIYSRYPQNEPEF